MTLRVLELLTATDPQQATPHERIYRSLSLMPMSLFYCTVYYLHRSQMPPNLQVKACLMSSHSELCLLTISSTRYYLDKFRPAVPPRINNTSSHGLSSVPGFKPCLVCISSLSLKEHWGDRISVQPSLHMRHG